MMWFLGAIMGLRAVRYRCNGNVLHLIFLKYSGYLHFLNKNGTQIVRYVTPLKDF